MQGIFSALGKAQNLEQLTLDFQGFLSFPKL